MRLLRDLRSIALTLLLCGAIPLAGIFSPRLEAQQIGGVYCSQNAQFSGTGPQRLIQGLGSGVFVCGYDVSAAAAGTIQLNTGTGTNCGTNTQPFTPLWNIVTGVANFGGSPYTGVGFVPPNVDLCVTAAPAAQIMLYFARQ